MTEPFLYNTAPKSGTSLIARQFRLTNAQANDFRDSDAMKNILLK